MKVIFISHNRKDTSNGVWKKMVAQVVALKNLANDVDFVYATENGLCIDRHQGKTILESLTVFSRQIFYKKLKKHMLAYDIAYIRKPHGGFYCLFLVGLLKKLKKINPKIQVYYEIPTYPYIHELKTTKAKILNFFYDLSFSYFKRYIDQILVIGDKVNFIKGIEVRNIVNGVDVKSIPIIKEKTVKDEFIIVAVANLSYWHGYDRLLKSLSEYNNTLRVELHIVGNTEPEFSRLKSIAKSLDLSDIVFFHGAKSGNDIRKILDTAHVCVDAIGRHRSNNNINSSIKSKEYAALGLPFIKSHIDTAFNGNVEFVYQVSANDETFSLYDLIHWRKNLKANFSVRERYFAEQELTWEKQFSFMFYNLK